MKKLILISLLFSVISYAQLNNEESIKKLIAKSEISLKQLAFDSSYYYAEKASKLAVKTEDSNLKALSYIALANSLFKKGKKNDAYIFGKKAEQIATEVNNVEVLLKSYLILGNIHYNKFEDEQSITYYQKIEKLATQNKIENVTLVKSLINTGYLFLRGYEDGIKKPFDRAETYFNKAYELSYKIKELDEYYTIGLLISSVHVSKKQFEKALKLLDKSDEYFKRTNNLSNLSQTQLAYASLYRSWGKNDLAEKYYLENIKINSKNVNGLARAHWSFAGYFFLKNSNLKAIEEYEKAIELFKKEKTIDIGPYSGSLYGLAESYKRNGNYDKAYTNLEKYLVVNDSLNAKQNQDAATEIEAKYQTEKKEEEIKLLSEVAKKNRIIYLSIVGLLFSIGTFLFYGYRNKIKTAQKLNELNELKSRFFANISHEFRTPLTLIKSPVQSLQNQIKDEDQKNKLDLIDKNSNRMLDLVDQLLELSKLDSGKLQLILKEGNITTFLNSLVDSFAFQAKENKLSFTSIIEKM